MKKRLNVALLIVSAAVIFALGVIRLVITGFQIGFPTEHYIFSDIAEFDRFLTASDGTVIAQMQPEQDKYLKGLVYEDYRAVEYSSEELHFLIFAYEFADADSTKAYFHNVTGKNVDFDTSFSLSSGMFGYSQLIVIDGGNAYRIDFNAKDYKKLEALIKESFTINITKKHQSTTP